MTDPNASPISTPIAETVVCRKCAYNLRGLSPQGNCPECGTTVAHSLQGDFLCFSDPNWLTILAVGARLMLWGLVVIVSITITKAVVIATKTTVSPVTLNVIRFLGNGLIGLGAWLVTTPDHSGIGEDVYGRWRKIVRILLLLSVIEFAASWALSYLTLPLGLNSAMEIIDEAARFLPVIAIIAQLKYLQKFCLRIPQTSLSRFARFLAPAIGISFGSLIAQGLLMYWFEPHATIRDMMPVAGCCLPMDTVVVIGLFIAYIVLLARLGSWLIYEAYDARKISAGPVADGSQ